MEPAEVITDPPLPASEDCFARSARVLVCEDSAVMLKHLGWLLEPLYEVCLTPSGERAVAAAAEFLPDLILCDLILPGIPGTEVCRRIRALPAFEDVPFVLMTALEDDEGRALGLESGADDYLRKPINERELLARVASLVRLRRVTESLRERIALLALRESLQEAAIRRLGESLARAEESASSARHLAAELEALLPDR